MMLNLVFHSLSEQVRKGVLVIQYIGKMLLGEPEKQRWMKVFKFGFRWLNYHKCMLKYKCFWIKFPTVFSYKVALFLLCCFLVSWSQPHVFMRRGTHAYKSLQCGFWWRSRKKKWGRARELRRQRWGGEIFLTSQQDVWSGWRQLVICTFCHILPGSFRSKR